MFLIKSLIKKLNFMKFLKRLNKNSYPYDSASPASRIFGIDRGTPIDRIYIEKFLKENAYLIKGNIIEVGDTKYSRRFSTVGSEINLIAGNENKKGIISWPNASFTDYETIKDIPKADCIIATQVLNFIYDFDLALKNISLLLNENGTLIATLGCLSPISVYDQERWGDYWRFTYQSTEKLFGKYFRNINIKSYGNSSTASGFIYGFAAEELKKELLEFDDPCYPIILAIKASNKENF